MKTFSREIRLSMGMALVGKVSVLTWLWWHRLPHYGADAVQLRQPAIELIRRGRYMLPTVWGTIPHAEVFFAAYPPGYSLFNTLWMALGGVSLRSFLAVDLGLHLIVAMTLTWVVLKWSGCWQAAIAFLVTTFAAILPLGRPEELGLALFLWAAAWSTSERRQLRYATFVPLGLAAVTGPITGAVAAIFAVSAWWYRDRLRWTGVAFVLAQGLGAVGVMLAIWGPLIAGHAGQFFEQFWAFRTIGYLPGPLDVVKDAPALVALCLVGTLTPWFLVPVAARNAAMTPHTRIVLQATRITLPAALVLDIVARRLTYDYRLVAVLGCAATAIVLSPRFSASPSRLFTAVVSSFCLLASVVQSVPLIRFAVSPLMWPSSAPSYESVIAEVRRLVPGGATLGGDGAFIELNVDHPVYADLNIADESRWPEFLVSSTWADPPYVIGKAKWATIVGRDYREVEPVGHSYHPGCGFPFGLPIARGTCEWNVRVWRRTVAETKR